MNTDQDDDGLPVVDWLEPVIMNIDYFDLGQVKSLAFRLGKGLSVIKYPDRKNYNVIHTSNLYKVRDKGVIIIFQT